MFDNRAYLLLESLIVIGILSLMLININLNYEQVRRNKIQLGLKMLMDDIYLTRNISTLGHEISKIEFNTKNNEYIIKNMNSKKVLKKVKFNSELYISKDNYNKKIQYDTKGIPRKGGSLTIYGKNNRKYIFIHRPVVGTLRLKEVFYE